MSDFDTLFNNSCLPNIINKAKTISKKECSALFDYLAKYKPVNILEFGCQHGCSTRVFLEMTKWLDYKVNLHSWDIDNKVIYIKQKDFTLHVEDLTNKEQNILSYKPDLVFLDAHPYELTYNLTKVCLDNKINFMCHDVSFAIIEALKKRSNDYKDKTIYAAWEPYVLSELISDKILTENHYEDDNVIVDCIRDLYGLAIIKNK